MKKSAPFLTCLILSTALGGCGMSLMPGSDTVPLKNLTQPQKPRPVDSLLTKADMAACEQTLGIAPPKTAADVYTMPPAAVAKIKDCAFTREKKHMPLLADLISSYQKMLEDGDRDCAKNIGTHYAGICLQRNLESAGTWYDKAVTQRISVEMPGQFPSDGQ